MNYRIILLVPIVILFQGCASNYYASKEAEGHRNDSYYQKVPPQFCGCSGMVVRKTAGQQSGIYCWPNGVVANPLQHKAVIANPLAANCPAGTTAYANALGQLIPTPPNNIQSFGFGFEIVASLVRGSTPQLCDEGQFARGEVRGAGVIAVNPGVRNTPVGAKNLPRPGGNPPYVANPVAQGQPYPHLRGQRNPQDLWGPDNYTTVNPYKRYDPANTIRWTDQPVLPIPAPPLNNVIDDSEFISYVLGTQGQPSCWCQFRALTIWNRPPGATNSAVRGIGGMRCQVP